MRLFGDIKPRSDGLVRAHTLVATVEGVAGDNRHPHLVAAGRHRSLEPLLIEDQADVSHVRPLVKARQHLFRIRHLRHFLRVDKARHLETAQPGIDQSLDELNLGGSGHDPRLALQPIARPDFDDFDVT